MLILLLSCSQPPCSAPLSPQSTLIDHFVRLEQDKCLHERDVESLTQRMKTYHTQTTLHCDQVFRRSSMDGLKFDGPEELVLEAASVADVVIDGMGRHIIAYNDTHPTRLTQVAQYEPETFWKRGLIGYGGLGLAIDPMNDKTIQYLEPDLHLPNPLELVDPDIGLTKAGQYRLSFFAVEPSKMNRTQHGPMAAAKPHNFYRSVSNTLTDFPTPTVIVASSEGSNGGADPAILSLKDGGEVLFVGPLDHTTMAWVSPDGEQWPTHEAPTYNTRQRFATPDAVPDPNGGYRLYGMTNGRPGEFQVSISTDGQRWQRPQTVLRQQGAFNISVGVDPVGIWWAYYNKTDLDCVEQSGARKILPPNVQGMTPIAPVPQGKP